MFDIISIVISKIKVALYLFIIVQSIRDIFQTRLTHISTSSYISDDHHTLHFQVFSIASRAIPAIASECEFSLEFPSALIDIVHVQVLI